MKANEKLIELVDGLLLGDASIARQGYLVMDQMDRRLSWLYQVQKILTDQGVRSRVAPVLKERVIHFANGAAIGKPASRITTSTTNFMKTQRARWYPLGTKRVPHDVRVTPISIAHWFAGDGTCTVTGCLKFCTNGFTESEVKRLASLLPVVADHAPVSQAPGQFIVQVNRKREALRLANLIRSHLPACCQYKLRYVRLSRACRIDRERDRTRDEKSVRKRMVHREDSEEVRHRTLRDRAHHHPRDLPSHSLKRSLSDKL